MATDATAQQNAGAAPAALDPTIVNLAKAIRQTESGGNFSAKGKSGEVGAYQFTPDTWNAAAPKYGINVPIEQATPQQQNAVAYNRIKEWKDSGKNVAQIASMWNAGPAEPDAYTGKFGTTTKTHKAGDPSIGTNSYGAKYDVPGYAYSIANAYQKLKGGGEVQADPNNPSSVANVENNQPAPSPGQQADAASAQKYGAFFPAATGEGAGTAALKTAGNLPGSAFNFAKGAVSTLNPVNTVGNIAQIPGAFSDVTQQQGGVLPAIAATAKEIPGTAYNMLVPEALRAGISALGGFAKHPEEILPTLENMIPGVNVPTGYQADIDKPLQEAQRAITNDPFGQVAPMVIGARAAAGAVDAATGGMAKANMADYVKNIEENTSNGVPIPKGTGTDIGGATDAGISKTAQVAESPVKYAFGKAADLVRTPAPAAEDVAGKILQGTEQEAAKGAEVLARTDTTGVKTYEDLSKALDTSIKTDLGKVDEHFASVKTKTKLADLKQDVTSESNGSVGKASINYVKDALSHLQELYFKTKDPANEARIKALTTQAKRQGLTPTEINAIAREYGTEFGSKAFSKRSGDPLTSVNAQAFENIRTGIKETARGFLETNEAKVLDKGVAQTIKVKKLVDAMAEKVNKLEQRVTQRNVVEKIGRVLGIAVDTLTGGALKAFVQKLFFPSNVGLKTLNSIDLESQLSRNLQIVKKLEGASDTDVSNFFVKSMRVLNQLPEKTTVPYVFGSKQKEISQ